MRVTAAEKQAQIDSLNQLKKDGRLTGTHSAYAILKDMFPRGKNPGLKTIGGLHERQARPPAASDARVSRG